MKNYLLLSFVSLLAACDLELGSSFDPTTRTLYIDHYREACSESSTDLCFRIRLSEEDSFALTTLPMTGFDSLEWGSRYQVQVEADRSDSGKDVAYSLESIDSTEVMDPATNDFVLTFNTVSGILVNNSSDDSASSWIIAAEKIFSCEAADCANILSATTDSQKIQLNFSASNNELTLKEVTCYASENDFATECEGVNNVAWDIAHYRTDCGLYKPSWCYVYKETGDSATSWNLLDIGIADFTAFWGQEYDIDVKTTKKAGTISSAIFLEQNASKVITSSFKFVMQTGVGGLVKSNNDVISYLDVEFDCSTNNQCSDIDGAIDEATDSEDRILIVEASVETSAEIPVIIIGDLVCHAGSAKFKVDCAADLDDVYWVEK